MLFLNIGGIEALAVFGVVATLHRFTGAVIIGTSQTLIPLVGVFHEEQDITSIKQTIKYVFFYGNILMFIFGALYCVFGAGIAALFGLPADSGFAAVMPLYAVYCILLLNVTIFSSYYNAIKKLFLANIIVFLQEFALLCGAALFLAVSFDFGRIWFAFPASSVLTFAVLSALLLIKHIRSKENTAFLLLNRNLQKNGKYISFSIDSGPEHISEAAAKISDFCEESGLPLEETMLISMSVEEIVTLIINNSKNKSFSVSVRLFLFEGGIVLRIRNTGEKFNVIEYYKSNIADDIEKSLDVLGMKYIVETAKVTYYRQTFGVNNLVVII
jgi:anti-sigma regulatory factor (Ser/Thr protein kinase)